MQPISVWLLLSTAFEACLSSCICTLAWSMVHLQNIWQAYTVELAGGFRCQFESVPTVMWMAHV